MFKSHWCKTWMIVDIFILCWAFCTMRMMFEKLVSHSLRTVWRKLMQNMNDCCCRIDKCEYRKSFVIGKMSCAHHFQLWCSFCFFVFLCYVFTVKENFMFSRKSETFLYTILCYAFTLAWLQLVGKRNTS